MEKNLNKLIEKFNNWYQSDRSKHRSIINFYSREINEKYLENLNENDFFDFFSRFIRDGGQIQSLGQRNLKNFLKYNKENYIEFKKFILEPFKVDFNLESWYNRIEKYKYFGVGIATIYLNRVDRDKYSVINGKTLKCLKNFSNDLTFSFDYKNYRKVNLIQKELIEKYLIFEDYFKIDSFNHYVIGTNEEQEAINEYLIKMDLLEIQNKSDLTITQKENLILCRIGQGNFRNKLIKLWGKCSVTGFRETSFLIASHIKPWKDSEPNERLDEFNGLSPILLPMMIADTPLSQM